MGDYAGKKEIRRFRRFHGYDYSRGAAFFISIVTNPRRRLFGEIVGAKLRQTPLGQAVARRLGAARQSTGAPKAPVWSRPPAPFALKAPPLCPKGLFLTA